MKKTLAFGIVFLFIGVAFAPSLYADAGTISEQQEFVEYTIEFYGLENQDNLKGVLTKDKADRLNSLFDELESDLNNATSEFETITILNNCIDELNTLGFIGDNDVEEFQRIIKSYNQEQILDNPDDKDINYDCLIIGRTTNTSFVYPKPIVAFLTEGLLIISSILELVYNLIKDPFLRRSCELYMFLVKMTLQFINNRDLKIFHKDSSIAFGLSTQIFDSCESWVSSGWVWTLGKNGIVEFDGGRGKLGIYTVYSKFIVPIFKDLYIGAKNFKGIRLVIFQIIDGLPYIEDSYMGFASEVSIG